MASNERKISGIEDALHLLAQADRLLDQVTETNDDGPDDLSPRGAAHVWIARAMCLLIDSLEDVEDVTFSDGEKIPVARTREPYTHLSARYMALTDHCREMVQEHGEGIWRS